MVSIRDDIEEALGHVCVPFSTEEEAEKGQDALILLLLEGMSAVLKARKSTEASGMLLYEIFRTLDDGGHFHNLTKRLEETVSLIEVYKAEIRPFNKKEIAKELKKRNIL